MVYPAARAVRSTPNPTPPNNSTTWSPSLLEYCAIWRVAVFIGKAFTMDPPSHSELGSMGARERELADESRAAAFSLRSWSPSLTVLASLASVASSHAWARFLSCVAGFDFPLQHGSKLVGWCLLCSQPFLHWPAVPVVPVGLKLVVV